MAPNNKTCIFSSIGVCLVVSISLLVAIGEAYKKSHPQPTPPPPPPPPDNPIEYPEFDNIDNSYRFNYSMNTGDYKLNFTLASSRNASNDTRVANHTEFKYLSVLIETIDDHLLHITIAPNNTSRYRVPPLESDPIKGSWVNFFQHYKFKALNFSYEPNSSLPFGMNFTENDGTTIFSTTNGEFRFFDNYVVLQLFLSSPYLFGLGERNNPDMTLRSGVYTLFNREQYAAEDGLPPGKNTFGSHPFLLNLMSNRKFSGFFMNNSNAMDVNISLASNSVTYKMVGGIIDLYVIHQADAETIIRKYHCLIDKPYLPPFWALGLQIGRSYKSTADIDTLLSVYSDYPVDAVWIGTELMDSNKDLTINPSFNNIQTYADSLAAKNIHLMTVLSAGIKVQTGYPLYDLGKSVAIMNNNMTGCEVGKTYAGDCIYLDFNNSGGIQLWTTSLGAYMSTTHIYGFSLDLNEIATESNGTLSAVDPTNYTQNMSYFPGNTSLNLHTISMDAKHLNGITEFNMHNLYGYLQTKATAEYMNANSQNQRVFLISRSTFPGSGKYGGHFLANLDGGWNTLKYSINNVINFNMFGIPFTGPDTGGFNGITDDNLCQRWMQLSGLLPLFRFFHNGTNEFPTIGPLCKVMSKGVITQRYSLIRFLYTKIFESSIWGGTVIQPTIFEFPNAVNCRFENNTDQFMVGHALLVHSPQSLNTMGPNTVNATLPNWRWWWSSGNGFLDYNYNSTEGCAIAATNGLTDGVDIFVKGGVIIPYQNLSFISVKSTADLINAPSQLFVYTDHLNSASGTMIVDDGISQANIDSGNYRHYNFVYSNHVLKINLLNGFGYTASFPYELFYNVTIYDNTTSGNAYACLFDSEMNIRNLTITRNFNAMGVTISDQSGLGYLPYNKIESIVWVAAGEQNVCVQNNLMIKNTKYDSANKTVTATLYENLAFSSNQITYSFRAAIIDNYVANIRITKGTVPTIPGVTNDTYIASATSSLTLNNYSVEIPPDNSPFYFKVNEGPSSANYFFSLKNMQLIYGNHFIQVRAKIRGTRIFGLGERIHSFELQDGIYTLMAKDIPSPEEDGKIPGKNMYGQQPFYLISTEDPNIFSAVFLINASPMDFRFKKIGPTIIFDHIMTGGDINFYFIQKGTANDIIKAYHRVIGMPTLVPFWSHGFHQCRYGWHDLQQLKDVYSNFTYYKIPLDVLWTDIDYMKNYQNFVLDNTRYYGLPSFITDVLHANNVKFVPIIDSGLARNTQYAPYNVALAQHLLMTTDGVNPLIGIVWPGYAVYTDFFNPNANNFWISNLQTMFNTQFPFDGIWIDMNEPSNFCDGECSDETHYIQYTISTQPYDNLIYLPSHRNLDEHMSSTGAQYYGGISNIDVYGAYGHMESIATSQYFTNNNQRPFIISRSNFLGSGKYASHWLGDNYAYWSFLRYSVSGIYNYQMFGIPLVGADICGFMRDSSEELCERWMQLGAFYPFSRNHNDISSAPQEPYVYQELIEVSKVALELRYALIRYFYTNYMKVAAVGGVYFRPLLFDYANDTNAYYNTEDTFLVGDIKVSPVMDKGATSSTTYFPNDDWYDLLTGQNVLAYDPKKTMGVNLTFAAPISNRNIPVHIRGGSIVVMQDTVAHPVQTTKDLEKIGNVLIIALSKRPIVNATGLMYFDDGIDLKVLTNQKYMLYNMTYFTQNKTFIAISSGKGFSANVVTNTETIKMYHNGIISTLPKCAIGRTLSKKDVIFTLTTNNASTIIFSPNSDLKMYEYIRFADLELECKPKEPNTLIE